MISAIRPATTKGGTSGRNQPTRRPRGPRARGPKPKVCDLCQLRKVKCDKQLPRCSLCQKVNQPCTYDRNGFADTGPSEVAFDPPRVQPAQGVSLVQELCRSARKSNLLLDRGGTWWYFGPSLATHYLASNHKLLQSIIKPTLALAKPLAYNRRLAIDITPTVTRQLVELYFAHLNAFYPLVDPTNFFSQLNGPNHSLAFAALLDVVCLSGASFYPNRTFGRIIAMKFSRQATASLRRIFLRPSFTAMQACILAAFHISVCEENTVLESSWFVLGVAKTMGVLLGVPFSPPTCSFTQRGLRNRMWWLLFCTSVTISHCAGWPLSISSKPDFPFPSLDYVLPSINFSCPAVFLSPEVLNLTSDNNLAYFRAFTEHITMVAQRIELKTQYEHNPDAYQPSMLALEAKAIAWYVDLPPFATKNRPKAGLYLPQAKDLHLGQLAIFFFSTLVDLNKPFITAQHTISATTPHGRSLSKIRYLTSNPLEKCALATFYGTQVFLNGQQHLLEVGIPYMWYCGIQFIFVFLYIIQKSPPDHWAVAPARRNAKFLFAQFQRSSDRWAIIRDAYFMLKPFVDQL